jgi:hypothetical protein
MAGYFLNGRGTDNVFAAFALQKRDVRFACHAASVARWTAFAFGDFDNAFAFRLFELPQVRDDSLA